MWEVVAIKGENIPKIVMTPDKVVQQGSTGFKRFQWDSNATKERGEYSKLVEMLKG